MNINSKNSIYQGLRGLHNMFKPGMYFVNIWSILGMDRVYFWYT